TRKRRRPKPTIKLTAFGDGRLKLDKDQLTLVCLPRTGPCPPQPESKDGTVVPLGALSVDPPTPVGGTPATVRIDRPDATDITLTAVGGGCGGFASHGPAPSPLVVTAPVGSFGACTLTADVVTPGGPEQVVGRFEVEPTAITLPALTVTGGFFLPGDPPDQTGSPEDPVIGSIEGPTVFINGGSVQFRLHLTDPSRV